MNIELQGVRVICPQCHHIIETNQAAKLPNKSVIFKVTKPTSLRIESETDVCHIVFSGKLSLTFKQGDNISNSTYILAATEGVVLEGKSLDDSKTQK